jgi:3-oxoacyl-[acyl-carrier protein] reductase
MPQDIQAALAGQVAIVTGGSRNIGRAIALRLAAEGAAVAVVGRNDGAAAEGVATEITEAGGRALARLVDVTDEAGVGDLVDEVAAAYGRVDILVNNAAVRRRQPLDSMTLAQWREITGVILDGAFLCARACVPHMIAAGAGSIVNIGGLSGHTGAAARAHVVASKAGIVGFTKALAAEFADRGIRANCVVPGTIDTLRGETAQLPHSSPGGEHPLIDRLGRPEEIAATVAHLCRPDSAYITGQTHHVNGGRYLP